MIEVKTEIKKYLKYCSLEKKLSKHTLKAYRIDLAQFIAFKPDISLSLIHIQMCIRDRPYPLPMFHAYLAEY